MKVNRNPALDALRIMAFMMIMLIHGQPPTSEDNSFLQIGLNYVSVPGLGMFFMISGFLLLPAKQPFNSFLRHRLGKLCWPVVIWSMVYILLDWLCIGESPAVRRILSVPLAAVGSPMMWFMYALVGFYLVTPIVSPWLQRIELPEASYYLLLFVLPFLYPIIEGILTVDRTDGSFVYYFAGYGAYFYLGWYLKRFPSALPLRWLALGVIVALCVPVACRLAHVEVNFYHVFWTQSIFVLVMAAFWFRLFTGASARFQQLSQRTRSILAYISNLTFGMYVMHFVVLRYTLWRIPAIMNIEPYIIKVAVIWGLGILISALVCFVISRFRIGRYVIGFSVK